MLIRRHLPAILSLALACAFTACSDPDDEAMVPDLPLGQSWRLTEIVTGDGAILSPEDRSFSLALDAEGGYAGRADCNSYFGEFTGGRAGRVAFGNPASTQVFCGTPLYDAYFDLLTAADRYEVNASTLNLLGGEATARFVPEP